jgi:hypothetical protein
MKHLVLLVAVLSLHALTASFLSAQSGKLPWVDGDVPPTSGAFDYRVSRGEGRSLRAAREDAFNAFLMDLGNHAGVRVTSRTLSEIKRSLSHRGSAADYAEGESSTTTYRIDREGFKASFIKVSECYERLSTSSGDVFRVWELYEVSSNRSFQPYIPAYTDRYGVDAIWRSAILPGWGQLYKGSKTKGLFIMGGEVALAVGIVATENLNASYRKKINESHNADHIQTYAGKADNMQNIRNICIAGAAALYLYNLIDAIAAPGNKHLIIHNTNYSFYPVANETYTGIGLAINF